MSTTLEVSGFSNKPATDVAKKKVAQSLNKPVSSIQIDKIKPKMKAGNGNHRSVKVAGSWIIHYKTSA
jgi:hypothetical protein